MVLARWGLVPFFAKSLAEFKGFSTFNARAESITTTATWRFPLQRRRCAVPADGFYEWKKLTAVPVTPKVAEVAVSNTRRAKLMPRVKKPPPAAKRPYAISLRNGEPMAFAGLWDAWKEPKRATESLHAPDRWLQSFSIITTEANEIMAAIHNRMPVILPQRDWAEWLERDAEKPPPIHLLRPFDSETMQAVPYNPSVGNVRNNGPDMLVCPAPDTLPLNSA